VAVSFQELWFGPRSAQEAAENMIHTISLLRPFLKPYRIRLALALIVAFGETASGLLQPWPLKLLFDNVFRQRPLPHSLAGPISSLFGSGRLGVLTFVLIAWLAIIVLGAVSSFTTDFLMTRVGNRVLFDLRRQIYWHIQRLSLAYHDSRRTGELMSTLTGDVQAVQDMVSTALIGIVMSTLMLLGMVVIMFLLSWRFALLSLSIAPVLFVVVYRLTRRVKRASRVVRRREGEIASIVQEVLSSIRVVQAFTREDYEQDRFERENERRVSASVEARTLQSALGPIVDILVGFGTVLVLWYGARQVIVGALSPGSLLVFLAYLGQLYRPMRDLSKLSDTVYRASVGMERVSGVLATERSIQDEPGARTAQPFGGRIEFREVSFSYGRGEPTLFNIDLAIEPGQVVAIVGSTGAGKTTLASLIPRFNDPARGSVSIDGHDVRSYTLASLRNQIALVLQETVLFYGSIKDNIAYGRPEASLHEIVSAAHTANAHDFIMDLPDGYDTWIGERGVMLSGGQKQRIAIARAIVRNAPIVLLDEPTTGLDASSEALVVDAMGQLMNGRTVVVIAHRLSTVIRADQILVLERGHIIERGTHAQLLATGGRYAELYYLQFRSHEPQLQSARTAQE
jgi:subfamily B ATP-binding cassette protein MsbA